jgi:hypothetical protein
MADTLGSALIVVKNDGVHGMYAADPANSCVDDKVNAYLIDGKVPAAVVDCDTAEPPMAVPERPNANDPDPAAVIPPLGQTADRVEAEVENEAKGR